ncbi:hypothetical protein HNR42_001929 [Deinobacterium chartae]|uniref:Holin-X, holin superfamily III n=1 Tax=Deinobacterium chartae TaxID=521158 RepID=A0A841I3K1_9DEIO|nr:phage holin family protein [Deinobacterium chartae]MBB6098495.1 hypothetical protein [Deinobacterium chartae]
MQPDPQTPKSIGAALVDVFDALITLVRTEISSTLSRVAAFAKQKGLGVALLLAALGPVLVAVVFLLLAAFYGLSSVMHPAWAALIMGIVSLLVAGAIGYMGLKKLGGEPE